MPWRGPEVEGEVPTLGWAVAEFVEENVVVPDGEWAGEPFKLNEEQLEFLLHLYRLYPDADLRYRPDSERRDWTRPSRAFVYDRGGQLVCPQKWGKSPFAAAWIVAEAFGPVLFDGWNASGEPVGRPWTSPLIQVTAVSEDQTDNVYDALVPMLTLGALEAKIVDLTGDKKAVGKTRIDLPDGGRIEPVTSSARSRLGQRITAAVQDEAHDWTKRNGGRKLADTQRRNLAGMGGRFLEIGNAWDPAEGSVAQFTWEHETGVYKLMLDPGEGSIRNARDRSRMLRRLYGKAWWVDQERVSAEIDNLLSRGEVAQAERFFLNRIVSAEDRAFDLKRWHELRKPRDVPERDVIAIGVDGARYEDALAVIATHVESGYQWPLGIWQKPENAPEDYEHPLEEVDGVLADAFERWTVWRAYVDPGSQTGNITALMERWQGRWGEKVVVPWLMTRPRATAFMFRNFVSAILSGDVTHDGDALFAEHIGNARRRLVNVYDEDGKQMWTIQKDSPRSPRKIDAAAAAALSWEARGDAISSAAKPKRKSRYADPDARPMFV